MQIYALAKYAVILSQALPRKAVEGVMMLLRFENGIWPCSEIP